MDAKLLVVDDDPNICEIIRLHLENEGYQVKTAADGVEALNLYKTFEPDLMLLDIMLPKKDGWQVLREIRETYSNPVIMVSAKSETIDKVLGLELGADDYITKPFEAKELVARVKAVLRRSMAHTTVSNDEVVRFDNLEVSIQKYELKLNGKIVRVPPKES